MKKLLFIFLIITSIIYSQNISTIPAPLYPDSGSPLLGSMEFSRLTHTLHISNDQNKFIFSSNIKLILLLLFMATIFTLFTGRRIIIGIIIILFRLDKNLHENKFVIIFITILTIFISFCYMLPTTTIIDFNDGKVYQKNMLFLKGDSISIKSIKELQIIPKKICYEDYDDDTLVCGLSYEFNLLLYDNSRINITDHFEYFQIADEAIILSDRLKKPLQDYRI